MFLHSWKAFNTAKCIKYFVSVEFTESIQINLPSQQMYENGVISSRSYVVQIKYEPIIRENRSVKECRKKIGAKDLELG